MNGCTKISAVNYDLLATVWDHSCVYLVRHLGYCLKFSDIEDYEDRSFTMSYSTETDKGAWVFFHDYQPDIYFHTREKLFNAKSNKLFRNHDGDYGVYHDAEVTNSFFIDVVFRNGEELTLNTVDWISDVLNDKMDNSDKSSEWNTLTHISVWNSQQHTGRIALKDVFEHLQYETNRKTKGQWSFNDFRNVLADRGTQFIGTLFDNYALDPNSVAPKSWYEKELLQDKYMIVRFEFDNSQKKQLILHDTTITAKLTGR